MKLVSEPSGSARRDTRYYGWLRHERARVGLNRGVGLYPDIFRYLPKTQSRPGAVRPAVFTQVETSADE